MAKAPKPEPTPDETPTTPPAQDTLVGQDTPPAGDAVVALPEPVLGPVVIEVPVLQVVGPAKGRWRIKQKFTPEVTVLVLADLTDAQVRDLKADPELVVIDTTMSTVALTT